MAIDIENPGGDEAALKAALIDLVGATARTIPITTGASQTDITLPADDQWAILNYEITTGGTAGVEVVNFLGPADGAASNSTAGRMVNVALISQTNGADVVHIKFNTDDSCSCIDSLGNGIGTFDTGVLDYVVANLVFGLNGDAVIGYRWNCLYGAWNSATVIAQQRRPLPTGGAFGQLLVSQGDDESWSEGPITPLAVFNGGTVAALNSNYPAATYPNGMARVANASSPVVGQIVAGGGSTACIVISNGANYLVMFIFP